MPVTDEEAGPEPEGGHPPAPKVGMVPREHSYWDYPTCAAQPPWPSSCYPPSEWETPQDLSDCIGGGYPDQGVGGICASGRAYETPRQTRDVTEWADSCDSSWHPISCGNLLNRMKWPLDYLGAHPWCVLNEYYDRLAAYDLHWSQGNETAPRGIEDRHGWHLCPTVIDPPAPDDPTIRLSETGLSVARRCRIVLPADVQLETTTGRRNRLAERFGSDCDAWASWVESRTIGRSAPECYRSARLAEEWMEHHHLTPERYAPMSC